MISMNNPLVSIIVPVYNAIAYLEDCVMSLMKQSYKNLEILLIDDGSTDGSAELCDKLECNRVKVFHKRNGGVTSARKFGVEHCLGQWIAFVDADDTLPQNAITNLVSMANETELVIGFFMEPPSPYSLTLEEARRAVLRGDKLEPSPWGKLFKKTIFENNIFSLPSEIKYGEDMLMNIKIVFSLSRPPRFVFKKVYNYIRHAGSVSHSINKNIDYESLYDSCRTSLIGDEMKKKYINDILWIRLQGLCNLAISCSKEIADHNHPYIKQIKSDINEYHYKMNLREKVIMNCNSPFVIRLLGYFLVLKYGLLYRLREYNIFH